MEQLKNFLTKNRVLLSAILSAVVLVLQQAYQSGATDYKALAFAVLVAVLGVIGNTWKGKGLSLAGIFGTLALTFTTIYQTGGFSWPDFIMASAIAIMSLAAQSLQPDTHEEHLDQPSE